MKWMLDLSAEERVEYLCFDSNKVSRNMFATVKNDYSEQEYVTPTLLASTVERIKALCTSIVPM